MAWCLPLSLGRVPMNPEVCAASLSLHERRFYEAQVAEPVAGVLGGQSSVCETLLRSRGLAGVAAICLRQRLRHSFLATDG